MSTISQRFSYQREKIFEAVQKTNTHPTAETVYAWLKPDLPKLSLGTVYRNLHQMAQEGRLSELSGPTVRFDAQTAPHTHFCCTRCGAVRDLDLPYEKKLDLLVERTGCRVKRHNLTFYGICPECAGKNKGNSTDVQ